VLQRLRKMSKAAIPRFAPSKRVDTL
jgi:hypothetical protein